VGNTQHGLVIGNKRAKPWAIRLVTSLISQGLALYIYLYLIIVSFREMFSAQPHTRGQLLIVLSRGSIGSPWLYPSGFFFPKVWTQLLPL